MCAWRAEFISRGSEADTGVPSESLSERVSEGEAGSRFKYKKRKNFFLNKIKKGSKAPRTGTKGGLGFLDREFADRPAPPLGRLIRATSAIISRGYEKCIIRCLAVQRRRCSIRRYFLLLLIHRLWYPLLLGRGRPSGSGTEPNF